jgi:hypothetical protein
LKLAAWANCKKKERWGKRRKEEGGEGCTMGSCNQQSRLGVLCIAACVSVCILLAVPTVLCFATRVSLVEEEEGARGGGGGGGAAATAIIQEKPLPFIVLHGIGDECKNHGLYQFTQLLINTSGAVGFCMYVVVLFSCPVHLRCIFSLTEMILLLLWSYRFFSPISSAFFFHKISAKPFFQSI